MYMHVYICEINTHRLANMVANESHIVLVL